MVVFLSDWVSQIPMAALVAVMIMVSIGTFSWASVRDIKKNPLSSTIVTFATVAVVVATHNLAYGVGVGVLLAALFFAQKVSHYMHITSTMDADAMHRTYTVTGEVFFSSADKFGAAFDFKEALQKVTIDLSQAHFWDISAVAAMDKMILKFRRTGAEVEVVGLNAASATLIDRFGTHDKPGALDDSVIDAIRKRFGLGWWGVSLRLYGREEVNKAAYKVLEKAMTDIGPLSIRPTTWVKGQPMEYSGWTGTPITFPMQNANWYGGRGGHIGFSPIIPQSGSAALAQFQRTYARYREYGMDYQGSFAFGERHLTNVNAMLFNKDDPAMMARIDPFFRQLVADAKAAGYGEYRTHLDYMDLVADSYDFNDGALRKLNEKVKDALDPNGILAPGKSGIWPRGLAGERGK